MNKIKTLETQKLKCYSLTFIFESRTGDSRNEVGLSPGGIVKTGDLEIGSFAGDISLYLAPEVLAEVVAPSEAESGRDPVRFGSSCSCSLSPGACRRN
jgi:hypothetical protein